MASNDYEIPGVLQTSEEGGGGASEVIYPQATSRTSLTVSVTTSEGAILAANANRVGFLLINNSSVDCYVTFSDTGALGSSAQANGGGLLKGNGGAMGFYPTPDLGEISGITASGTAIIHVTEWSNS